jgi:hypothetical protein
MNLRDSLGRFLPKESLYSATLSSVSEVGDKDTVSTTPTYSPKTMKPMTLQHRPSPSPIATTPMSAYSTITIVKAECSHKQEEIDLDVGFGPVAEPLLKSAMLEKPKPNKLIIRFADQLDEYCDALRDDLLLVRVALNKANKKLAKAEEIISGRTAECQIATKNAFDAEKEKKKALKKASDNEQALELMIEDSKIRSRATDLALAAMKWALTADLDKVEKWMHGDGSAWKAQPSCGLDEDNSKPRIGKGVTRKRCSDSKTEVQSIAKKRRGNN